MVLEELITPLKAEKRPWEMFFIGMLYSSVALIISMFLFPGYASIIMVFFTVMAAIPIIYWTIKEEEKKDLEIHDEKVLIREHSKALAFFVFLFLGFVFSFALWYIFLPPQIAQQMFEVQVDTISRINNPLAGNAFNIASTMAKIFLNNFRVMIFCLIFAFFYGFGSIFILTWNASILAVAIGDIVRKAAMGISLLPIAMFKYLVHGIPEILAYFMAGMAGGIISVAVIRHDFGSGKFKHIIVDSLDLMFGAVIMLVIAALLEVFVSPFIL